MPSLQVKNVPEETLAVLRRRAAERHQSLQEFMLERLIVEAQRPTWDEVFAHLDAAGPGIDADVTPQQIADLIREDRGPL